MTAGWHGAARYLIALGSNIDPRENLPLARARLAADLVVERWSSVYESDAVGAPGTPRFQNQAGVIATRLDLGSLKQYFRSVEAELGRARTANPNAPRTIDIDVVLGIDDRDRVRADVPRDPELETLLHLCVPAAELLGGTRLVRGGPTLAEMAVRRRPLPAGFVQLGDAPSV